MLQPFKKIGSCIKSAAGWIACGLMVVVFFWRSFSSTKKVSEDSSNAGKTAEKKANDVAGRVKNEIQKTDAAALAADSPDAAAHRAAIADEQQQFRERVRNRFEQNVQRK
jgi:hypothetical protein